VDPAVIRPGALPEGEGHDIGDLLYRGSRLHRSLEVFLHAGRGMVFDREGQTDKLIGLLVDTPLLPVEFVDLLKFPGPEIN